MNEAKGSILVTGASTGIGLACALQMDRLGYQVFAGIRRREDALGLGSNGSARLETIMLDVTEPDSIAAAVEHISAKTGEAGLAGLVNNAGIGVGGPIEYLPLEELQRVFAVNLIAPIAMTQALLPLIRRARGRIVNISSISGRISGAMIGPYAASKHALEAVSDALREELRPEGLHVALVEPGVVDTPIFEKAKKQTDEILARIPEEGRRRYGPQLESFAASTADIRKRAITPDRVAGRVAHALTASRPKIRYVVGRDARTALWLRRVLPERAFHWFLRRASGSP